VWWTAGPEQPPELLPVIGAGDEEVGGGDVRRRLASRQIGPMTFGAAGHRDPPAGCRGRAEIERLAPAELLDPSNRVRKLAGRQREPADRAPFDAGGLRPGARQ